MEKQQTILIVEDNDYNLHIAKELLEMAGYRILEATEADTGVQLAKDHHPDLILMDMYMPLKDGYEATHLIKSDPETQDIPIVAFTALAMHEDRNRAEAVGCIGIISKPIVVDTFVQTVESYIKVDGNGISNGIKPVAPYPASETLDPKLKEFLMKLSHDMQNPIRKIRQFSAMLRKPAEEKLNPEEAELLDRIERCTEQMEKVLADSLASMRETLVKH